MKNITVFILLFLLCSCSNEEVVIKDICSAPFESYVIINDKRQVIDHENSNTIFTCMYLEEKKYFVVAIDEFITRLGGVEINDVIVIALKMEELKAGVFPLTLVPEDYCKTKEFVFPAETAITSLQINNCCNFYNNLGVVEVLQCDDAFAVRMDNVLFKELDCEIEEGYSFTVSLQIACK